jgi:hypothetical protein
MKLLGLNRIELLVRDPDRAEADLSSLLGGLDFEKEPVIDDQSPLDCRIDWKAGIEIVHPPDPTHAVGRLLEDRGEHVFTVVFEVESIDDAREWVTSQGFGVMYEYDNGRDERPATIRQITIDRDRTHGLLVTLIERIPLKARPPTS